MARADYLRYLVADPLAVGYQMELLQDLVSLGKRVTSEPTKRLG